MLRKLKKIDWHLHHEFPLLILLLILIVLRLPNFLEPYWYGDEAIYLTIGTAMKQGALLYKDIIDHKTPLIYYLAMVPSQVHFRLLLTLWMMVSTTAFYYSALRLLKSLKITVFSTLIFVLLTTLPALEGNIPNGELFVMGFVLTALALLMNTQLYYQFFTLSFTLVQARKHHHPILQVLTNSLHNTRDVSLFLGAGFLLGLAVLTKVPAIFDAAGLLSVAWFVVVDSFSYKKFSLWREKVVQVITQAGLVGIGILSPIVLSIGYYALRGSLPEYLEYGLLYNFRYIQSWGLPFSDPTLVWFFSFPGKITVVLVVVLLLMAFKRWLTPAWQFIVAWSMVALFASLLSSRPYPHYFLQLVPPFSLLVGLLIQKLYQLRQSTAKLWYRVRYYALPIVIGVIPLVLLAAVMNLLNVGLYPTFNYYTRSLRYVTGQMSRQAYYQSFDGLMTENYEAAEIIVLSDDPHLFIWGTNPLLYALTEKSPTGRFTVSFHIKDFKAEAETLADLKEDSPKYVVIMENEVPLPGLTEYLSEDYIINSNFSHFTLWQRWENLPR
ncbi:MAG TPA: hypothetical protein VF209_03690 [Patescibacteria group bacterium]